MHNLICILKMLYEKKIECKTQKAKLLHSTAYDMIQLLIQNVPNKK